MKKIHEDIVGVVKAAIEKSLYRTWREDLTPYETLLQRELEGSYTREELSIALKELEKIPFAVEIVYTTKDPSPGKDFAMDEPEAVNKSENQDETNLNE